MEDITEFLRGQLYLAEDITAKLANLKQALQTSVSGVEVRGAVRELEPSLSELGNFEAWQNDILAARGAADFAELLESESASPGYDEAVGLFYAVQERQAMLKKDIAETTELLARCKKFIDYTLNVVSEAKAGTTYGPPGATPAGGTARRLYEANI